MNEVPDGAWWTIAGSVITAVAGYALRAWELRNKELKEAKARDDANDEKKHLTTVAEYQEILERYEKEMAAKDGRLAAKLAKIEMLTDRLSQCYQWRARAEEKILAHEEKLEANSIPFRKWVSPSPGDSVSEMETMP